MVDYHLGHEAHMNTLVATCFWILLLLTGCDYLLPPCTSIKQKVCTCDAAGDVMCETAKVAEEKAKELKEDEEEARYDSAQNACEAQLDTWKEAGGCSQFNGQGNDSDTDDENTASDPSINEGIEGGDSTPLTIDASLNCKAECWFEAECHDANVGTCTDHCLQTYSENEALCDGPGVDAYETCVAIASASCDDHAFDACILDYPTALTLCR